MDVITISINMTLSKLQEIVKDREACHAAVNGGAKVGHNLGTKQYQCITLEIHFLKCIFLMVFEGVTDFIKSLYYCDLLLETTTVAPLTVALPEK